MHSKLSKTLVLAFHIGLGLSSATALAYESGDMIFRAGIASVQPDDGSSNLSLSSTIPALNAGTLAGTGVSVDSAEALGLTATYMVTSNFGIEILAASPFQHDISANLSGLGLGVADAGSTKHLPPTLNFQWFPLASNSGLQPYVGIGVNYTKFFSEEVSPALDKAVGKAADILLGGTGSNPVPLNGKMKLEDSWGLSLEIGADYAIDEHWLLNASVWHLDIDTEATINFHNTASAIAAQVKTDVDIDPWVYMVALGYKF